MTPHPFVKLAFWTSVYFSGFALGADQNPLKVLSQQTLQKLPRMARDYRMVAAAPTPYDPPVIRYQDRTVFFRQTMPAEVQAKLAYQRVFNTLTDQGFSAGQAPNLQATRRAVLPAGVAAAPVADSRLSAQPELERMEAFRAESPIVAAAPVAAGAPAAPLYDYGDHWAIGNGWFGADVYYRSMGQNSGDTFTAGGTNATVVGNSTLLFGAQVQTVRNYNNTATVADDKLDYWVNSYFLNQKTQVAQGNVPTGGKYEVEGLPHFSQELFRQEYQYAIGPVPVLVTAWLQGEAHSGVPYIEFGLAPNQINEVSYTGQARPWGVLTGGAKAVAGGIIGVPENLLPAYVGAYADVDFLKGSVRATAVGTSGGRGPCLDVTLTDFKALRADFYVKAVWKELTTTLVTDYVDVVCDNGYIKIPGCTQVQSVTHEVQDWLSYEHREDLFESDGYDLGDRKWLDTRACSAAVDPTVVKLCNQSDRLIYSTVLVFDPVNNFWRSMGWYPLPAQGCTPVSLGNYKADQVYVYSEYLGGRAKWEGTDASFCVNRNDKFDIAKADNVQSCPGENFKMVKAAKLNVTANAQNTYNFLTFDYSKVDDSTLKLCNKTSYTPLYASYALFTAGSWNSRFWFEVKKDDCVSFNIGNYQGNVYVSALHDINNTMTFNWGRGFGFCVDRLGGGILERADTMACQGGGRSVYDFSLVGIQPGVTTTYDFTSDQTLMNKAIKNEHTQLIDVAFAYHEELPAPDARTFEGISGWYTVAPGTSNPALRRQSTKDKMWVYYRSTDGKEISQIEDANTIKACVQFGKSFSLPRISGDCPAGMEKKIFHKNPGTAIANFN